MNDIHDDHAHTPDALVCWSDPADLIDGTEDAEDLGIEITDIGLIPPDALAVFCRLLLPAGQKPSVRFWRTATSRLAVLAHACGVDPVAGQSLADIAKDLGICRATLSYSSVRLRDFGRLGHRAGRSDEAREVYAERARRVWRGRHAQATTSAP